MSKPLSDLLRQIVPQHFTDFAVLAAEAGLRRQFVYDLRDGNARTTIQDGEIALADTDPRYLKLDTIFRSFGITNFLEVALAAQHERLQSERPDGGRDEAFNVIAGLIIQCGFRTTPATIPALRALVETLHAP